MRMAFPQLVIFFMFCWFHFCCLWSAKIICLVILIIMFPCASDSTISCIMSGSIVCHSEVLGSDTHTHTRISTEAVQQCMHLGVVPCCSILSLWLNKMNCWAENWYKTWSHSTRKLQQREVNLPLVPHYTNQLREMFVCLGFSSPIAFKMNPVLRV